jgi:enoyl-CoA hydratase/carnithine racemase
LPQFFHLEAHRCATILRFQSPDQTNRLSRASVLELTEAIDDLAHDPRPLILTGNETFFSAGADLHEVSTLTAAGALEFSKLGQNLMTAVANYPAPVYAAICGYCMGGGLDLALACHRRIATPNTVFGHRGAALGLITGWGGTQRLPRLIGKGRAAQMFLAAEKVHALEALRIGLVDAVVEDPVGEALGRIEGSSK